MRTVEVFLNVAPTGRGRRFCAGDVLVGCGQYLRFRFEAGGGQDLEVLERAFEIGNLRGRDDTGRLYLPQIRSVSVGDVMRVDGVCCLRSWTRWATPRCKGCRTRSRCGVLTSWSGSCWLTNRSGICAQGGL